MLLRAHGYPGDILYAIFVLVKEQKRYVHTTIYDIDVPMINNSLHRFLPSSGRRMGQVSPHSRVMSKAEPLQTISLVPSHLRPVLDVIV